MLATGCDAEDFFSLNKQKRSKLIQDYTNIIYNSAIIAEQVKKKNLKQLQLAFLDLVRTYSNNYPDPEN